ncbi:MAG: hypothetical protein VX519_11930, partial [Myxococcota bacterium]|nr:hypothetical protein [Myxococcota bacterium]
NGILVRYEDVTSHPRIIDDMMGHVGLDGWDRKVLASRVRGWKAPPTRLTPEELVKIRNLAGPIAQRLGYSGPERGASNRALPLKHAG